MQAVPATKLASKESHLMSRALHAPGKKGIQFATRLQSGQNPKHMKAHLLCSDCEQRFKRLGESEVLRWLAPKARREFPLHDRLRVALPSSETPSYSVSTVCYKLAFEMSKSLDYSTRRPDKLDG